MLTVVSVDESVKRAFGARLRAARQEAGLSQQRLADYLTKLYVEAGMPEATITQSAVSQWELGQAIPRFEKLRIIEFAVRVRPGALRQILEGGPMVEPGPAGADEDPRFLAMADGWDDLSDDDRDLLHATFRRLRRQRHE